MGIECEIIELFKKWSISLLSSECIVRHNISSVTVASEMSFRIREI
jgi:hypothetical protein